MLLRGISGDTGGDGRGRPRGDLRSRPFPAIASGTPQARRDALVAIRAWAEQEAEDAIDWYLRDRRLKRRGSRFIRGLTILLAVAGTAVPLASSMSGGPPQALGYVLLALAAGCKGFDHFFGLSAAWMRDMAAAQALRTRLSEFRLAWTREELLCAGAAPDGPAGPDRQDRQDRQDLERRMELISGLVTAVHSQVEGETASWLTEFKASEQQLKDQTTVPGPAGLPPAGR
ncbi:SLATT domain-containing protein [Streptomyces longispororuber]|uniref:SLATT domain-containing protein n=1 Tax=Streptomyces longispororuber TaxID=68230 RepID=UPI00210BB3FC|nr:SLATT domain-containing protein [Streptomyces longispororuber]MCQ4211535.1 SLATT domain-containing protein [Streptomyces longispororuber]